MGFVIVDLICIILMMVSGISKAIMDKVNFHYSTSIFSKLNNRFWDHSISSNNKYKDFNKDNGPRFFLSTTILVLFTDAWHLFQFFFLNSLIVGFSIYGYNSIGDSLITFIFRMVMLMIIFKTTFELYFKYYLSLDKK